MFVAALFGLLLAFVIIIAYQNFLDAEGNVSKESDALESRSASAFYDDSVRQLNTALAARRDRLQSATGGLARDIIVLILFSTAVIIGYAVLVGSPRFWFHELGPAAIAIVVAVSLVVLLDLSYPFSGDVSISPDAFKTGSLGQFFHVPPRPH